MVSLNLNPREATRKMSHGPVMQEVTSQARKRLGGKGGTSPGFIVPAKELLEKLTIMIRETDLQKGKKKKERDSQRER